MMGAVRWLFIAHSSVRSFYNKTIQLMWLFTVLLISALVDLTNSRLLSMSGDLGSVNYYIAGTYVGNANNVKFATLTLDLAPGNCILGIQAWGTANPCLGLALDGVYWRQLDASGDWRYAVNPDVMWNQWDFNDSNWTRVDQFLSTGLTYSFFLNGARVYFNSYWGALQVPYPTPVYLRTKLVIPSCPSNSNCSASGLTCLPGFGYRQTQDPCTACPPNTFKSTYDQNPCQVCPDGFEQPLTGKTYCNLRNCLANATCDPYLGMSCNAGSYWDSTAGACLPCNAGFFKSSPGNQTCTPCPFGSCQPSTGKTSCLNCVQGSTFQPQTGQASCLPCPGNSTCNQVSFNCNPGFFLSAQGTCQPCAPGSFKSTSLNNPCSACSAGSYQPLEGQTNCVSCINGLNYQPQTGQLSALPCPDNSRCDLTSFQCNPGYGFNGSHCVPCAPGTAKAPYGNLACSVCNADTYQSASAQTSCLPCPVGADCRDKTTFICQSGYGFNVASCYACADLGQIKPVKGNSACLACPFGAVCNGTHSTCQAGYGFQGGACFSCLETGRFKNEMGNFACKSCPNGATCNGTHFNCRTEYLDGAGCVPAAATPTPTGGSSNNGDAAAWWQTGGNFVWLIAILVSVTAILVLITGLGTFFYARHSFYRKLTGTHPEATESSGKSRSNFTTTSITTMMTSVSGSTRRASSSISSRAMTAMPPSASNRYTTRRQSDFNARLVGQSAVLLDPLIGNGIGSPNNRPPAHNDQPSAVPIVAPL